MKKFIIFSVIFISLFTPATSDVLTNVNSHFGLVVNPYNEDWQDPERITKLLKELGVKLVITKLSWKNIEMEKGKFSQEGWKKFDTLVNRLSDLGIAIMPFIASTPEWAIDPLLSPNNWQGKKFGPPAKNPEDITNFLSHAEERYRDKINQWAIYNAPQNRNHWIEPKMLAETYRLARQVLDKQKCADKLVLSGLESARYKGPLYLEEFLQDGGGKYIDIYDFHMAIGNNTLSSIESSTIHYKTILEKYGEIFKPIQYGAVGYPSTFNPSKNDIARLQQKGWQSIDYAPMTLKRQAQLLVIIMIIGRSLGVEKIFWTRTRDHAPVSGPVYEKWLEKVGRKKTLIEKDLSMTRGIIDYGYDPKPSFLAFKVLLEKLDKAYVFENLDLGEDAKGIIFKESNKFISVFFTWEKEKTLTFRTSAKYIKVFNIFGKEEEMALVKDGKLLLKISPDPIYIEGDLHDLSFYE